MTPYNTAGLAQQMTDEEFGLLCDYVHERFGLYFDPANRHLLEFKLHPRLKIGGFGSYKDYYHYLMFHPNRQAEETRLIAALTNHESYFYRELNQLEVFLDVVATRLAAPEARCAKPTLRILSAGCSTGEEPYTIAMLLADSGRLARDFSVEIVGVDLDPAAVERARAAEYTRNSLRATPADKQARHFTSAAERHRLAEPIRSLVRLDAGNIVSAALLAGEKKFDYIFCRNVLIYFSPRSIRQATNNFHRLLADGGLLFLGHSESLVSITPLFVPVRHPRAIYYRKA